jgi:phosphopantothenoylcysteine decarboxylase / phosphopantothenate---cysteine ligase
MAGPFKDKVILLGITGSIAAYKACEIASRLTETGATVIPALTESAREFIGPVSLEAITGNPAVTSMFETPRTPEIEHIALAQRADLFLIAPASANIIAKAAQGIADDWLSTTLLATRAPVLFAPAMNTRMYTHPATRANIDTLIQRGCHFAGPGEGRLACGDTGPGRLTDTGFILEKAATLFQDKHDLIGKRILITSGATHEPIDPVRFIGNRSSGRMGRALAMEALSRGATVTVVSGPAAEQLPRDAQTVRVQTAVQMLDAVTSRIDDADIFIAAAAVGDYRIDTPLPEKHRRTGEALKLTLQPNPDIAATVGFNKRPGQIIVGFAAETHDLIKNAVAKLKRKNLDLVIANQVGGNDCAFGSDTARAMLITHSEAFGDSPFNPPDKFPEMTKEDLTRKIFDAVIDLLPDPLPVNFP